MARRVDWHGMESQPDWIRRGLRLTMAKDCNDRNQPAFRALLLVDNDPGAHTEWANAQGWDPR